VVKQCSKFVECVFFKSVNKSQSCHKSSEQLCDQKLVEQLQHFKTFVSRGNATMFLRNDEKYYISFVDNALLFPTVKNF